MAVGKGVSVWVGVSVCVGVLVSVGVKVAVGVGENRGVGVELGPGWTGVAVTVKAPVTGNPIASVGVWGDWITPNSSSAAKTVCGAKKWALINPYTLSRPAPISNVVKINIAQ